MKTEKNIKKPVGRKRPTITFQPSEASMAALTAAASASGRTVSSIINEALESQGLVFLERLSKEGEQRRKLLDAASALKMG